MANGAFQSVAIADWSLKDSVARKIFARFGTPDIDLMASQASRKVPRFISWSRADSEAVALDSLSSGVRWNIWELPYLFPPFSLIGKCLQKIREEQVQRIIVVLPWIPDSTHLGTAFKMLLRPPVRLSHTKALVTDLVTGQPPQGWKRRHLITCLLTGMQTSCRTLSKLMPSTTSRCPGGQERNPLTNPIGESMELRKLHLV